MSDIIARVLDFQTTNSTQLKNDLLNDLKDKAFETARIHCGRYGREPSQEEFSIALEGMSKAIDTFSLNKSEKFDYFAKWTIINKLRDFFKKEKESKEFVTVDSEKISLISDHKTYSDYKRNEIVSDSNEQMKVDLIKFNSIINKLGYSWVDIQKNRPKHKDSLEALRNIAIHICRLGLGQRFLEENPCSRQLKKMIGANIKRRTLNTYRPYLCAVVLTLIDDFPAMRSYLDFFKEGR